LQKVRHEASNRGACYARPARAQNAPACRRTVQVTNSNLPLRRQQQNVRAEVVGVLVASRRQKSGGVGANGVLMFRLKAA